MLLTLPELCNNSSPVTLTCCICPQVRALEQPAAQPLLFQPGALRSSQPRPSSGAAVTPPLPVSGSARWRPVRLRTCTAMCQSICSVDNPCHAQAAPGARRKPPQRRRAWQQQRSRLARRGKRAEWPRGGLWALACGAAAGPAAGRQRGCQGPRKQWRRSGS